MELTRRDFLAAAAATAAGTALAGSSYPAWAEETADEAQAPLAVETKTMICDGCSLGCSLLLAIEGGEITSVSGDPDSPVNQGNLCARGAAVPRLRTARTEEGFGPNPLRVTVPKVRRPGSKEWEDLSWEEALAEISAAVKKTRDEHFVESDGDVRLNYCPAIASFGGARDTAEEQYLIAKAMRSLGVLHLDSEVRFGRAAAARALQSTLGWPNADAPLSDLPNSYTMLTIGSNHAQTHPVSMHWVQKAQEAGATWIVVGPACTATAAGADVHLPIRQGTEAAFFGGMVKYILDNDLWQHEYVLNYTNISYLLDPAFGFDIKTGRFSGYNDETGGYDRSSWGYQQTGSERWNTRYGGDYEWAHAAGTPLWRAPERPRVKQDVTLLGKECVAKRMTSHYDRYDLDRVAAVCGVDAKALEDVYGRFCETGVAGLSGALITGSGLTAQVQGTQNMRAAALVQLLLGNIGVPGGGIHYVSGESNVQGAQDAGLAPDAFPGYLPWPTAEGAPSLQAWLETHTASAGTHANRPRHLVSLLKEWYGPAATKDNDYGYGWLARIPSGKGFAAPATVAAMESGEVKGAFVWGANPLLHIPEASRVRKAAQNLEWMVVADAACTETASFWNGPDADAGAVNTTVYLLPSATAPEKSGTRVNGSRLMQYSAAAVEPMADALADGDIVDRIWRAVRDAYGNEGGAFPDPILKLQWNYLTDDRVDPAKVCCALNGYETAGADLSKAAVSLARNSDALAADGTIACGNWLYAGAWNADDAPLDPSAQPVARRDGSDEFGTGLFADWAFSWPGNVRVRGNRASCDLSGTPWSPGHTLVMWSGGAWVQNDRADFPVTRGALPDNKAFAGTWERVARLAVSDLVDGPLPEYYVQDGAPVANLLNVVGSQGDGAYPVEAVLVEGAFPDASGPVGYLDGAFAESTRGNSVHLSRELARDRGIADGDWVRISSSQGEMVARASVNRRLNPFASGEATVHQAIITAPHGWGSSTIVGDAASELASLVADANTGVPGTGLIYVDVHKAEGGPHGR